MRFLIKCTCGHHFWRAKPCTDRLQRWTCPRRLNKYMAACGVKHETECTSLLEQMQFVHSEMVKRDDAKVAASWESKVGAPACTHTESDERLGLCDHE